MQLVFKGALDATELERAWAVVKTVTDQGISIVFGAHNYGRYNSTGQLHVFGSQGDQALTPEDFADLWSRLAEVFKTNPMCFSIS
jgi:hypothetical protein